MEKYLVTGGAGFIGSHIAEELIRGGHFVRIIDDFDTGTRENLLHLTGNLEVMEGSIADRDTIRKAIKGIDYVFHEAARGSVPRSIQDPLGTHQANTTGTIEVLDAAYREGVKRVVCASSSSIYGETPALPKEEDMSPAPLSPYAVTKMMLEHYCRMYSDVYGLQTVALRYFNVFGPRQNPNLQYAAVVPIFITRMIAGQDCIIYGDGNQTRDFTYIQDCVEANLLACKAEGVSGEAFNIAVGEETSVNQLFNMLKQLLGYQGNPVYEDEREGDVKFSRASIEKAKRMLKFQPKYNVEDGLKESIEWYRNR